MATRSTKKSIMTGDPKSPVARVDISAHKTASIHLSENVGGGSGTEWDEGFDAEKVKRLRGCHPSA